MLLVIRSFRSVLGVVEMRMEEKKLSVKYKQRVGSVLKQLCLFCAH